MYECSAFYGNESRALFLSLTRTRRIISAYAVFFPMRTGTAAVCLLLAMAGAFFLLYSPDGTAAEPAVLDQGTCGTDLTWTIYDDGHLVIEGSGDMQNYADGDERWGGHTVRSVSFPEGLTSIGDNAFTDAMCLREAVLPDTVSSIGEHAFSKCVSLVSVHFPDSLTSIGDFAFRECISLREIDVPAGVTYLDSTTFVLCESVIRATIGSADVEYTVLSDMINLRELNLGDGVTDFNDLMRENRSLLNINVGENNPNYRSVDGVLYNKDLSVLLRYPAGRTSPTYTIPDGVTGISDNAFRDSVHLRNVVIPDSVIAVSDYAFYGCTSLRSFAAAGLQYIYYHAFEGCTSLTSVHFSKDMAYLGNNAFNGCTSLRSLTVDELNGEFISVDGVLFNKSVSVLRVYPAGSTASSYTIPDTVTLIDDYAFSGSRNLRSVVIPDSVATIDEGAFYGSGLTSVEIPGSVTKITREAFSDCTSLTSATVPGSVTSLGSYSFYGCTALESVTLGNGIPGIQSGVFMACTSLKSVDIPDSVTSFDSSTFARCTALESVNVGEGNPEFCSVDGVVYKKDMTKLCLYPPARPATEFVIPDTVVSIWGTLEGCRNLVSLSIPASLVYINAECLDGCPALENITVDELNGDYRSVDGVLFSKDMSKLLRYPMGRTAATYEIPADVTEVYVGEWGFGPHLEAVTVADGNTCFSSDGTCLYSSDGTILYLCPSGVRSYSIPETVRTVEEGAFAGPGTEEITIGSGCVVYLEGRAVLNCTGLKKVVIEDGAVIGYYAWAFYVDYGIDLTVRAYVPDGFTIPEYACYVMDFRYSDPETGGMDLALYAAIIAAVLVASVGAVFLLNRGPFGSK